REGRRTATVTAATPMTMLVLGRVEFAQLLDIAPVVARRVLQDSASSLAHTALSRRVVASPEVGRRRVVDSGSKHLLHDLAIRRARAGWSWLPDSFSMSTTP